MKGINQLITGFSGSIENMTVVPQPDGLSVIKGKITNMTNPNTPKQQVQRSSFRNVMAIASALKIFLRQNFKPTKVTHSSVNSFVQRTLNYDNDSQVILTSQGLQEADMTNGDLYNMAVSLEANPAPVDGTGLFENLIQWPYDPLSQIQDGSDLIKTLVVNQDTLDWFEIDTGVLREDESASLKIDGCTGKNLVVTVYAVSASTGDVSTNSACFLINADGSVTDLNV